MEFIKWLSWFSGQLLPILGVLGSLPVLLVIMYFAYSFIRLLVIEQKIRSIEDQELVAFDGIGRSGVDLVDISGRYQAAKNKMSQLVRYGFRTDEEFETAKSEQAKIMDEEFEKNRAKFQEFLDTKHQERLKPLYREREWALSKFQILKR